MKQSIGYVSLVVRDYDAAIDFYVRTLDFVLIEDTVIEAQNKRWILLAPPGATESRLLIARAVGAEQEARIGNQTGGRVFLFLHTDDFWRDFRRYKDRGVVFVREPKEENYGTVAVFQDLYGNLWDLLQLRSGEQERGGQQEDTGSRDRRAGTGNAGEQTPQSSQGSDGDVAGDRPCR
jgi:catechol 2,3-dioxygenase-like lactoylglutathione lyase family enzyme